MIAEVPAVTFRNCDGCSFTPEQIIGAVTYLKNEAEETITNLRPMVNFAAKYTGIDTGGISVGPNANRGVFFQNNYSDLARLLLTYRVELTTTTTVAPIPPVFDRNGRLIRSGVPGSTKISKKTVRTIGARFEVPYAYQFRTPDGGRTTSITVGRVTRSIAVTDSWTVYDWDQGAELFQLQDTVIYKAFKSAADRFAYAACRRAKGRGDGMTVLFQVVYIPFRRP